MYAVDSVFVYPRLASCKSAEPSVYVVNGLSLGVWVPLKRCGIRITRFIKQVRLCPATNRTILQRGCFGKPPPTCSPGNKRVYHCRPRISIKWDRDLSGYTIPFLIILKSKSLTWPHETAVVDGTESWRGVTPLCYCVLLMCYRVQDPCPVLPLLRQQPSITSVV